jgi:hypothetical protein
LHESDTDRDEKGQFAKDDPSVDSINNTVHEFDTEGLQTESPQEQPSKLKHQRPTGTSQSAALRRLRKDRPDLLELVLNGDMSAHGAMVKAGFRPKLFQAPWDPDKIVAKLLNGFSESALERIIRDLKKGLEEAVYERRSI